MKTLWICGFGLAAALAYPAQGAEVAGVKLEDTVSIDRGGPMLSLNGAGIRKKFFVKVYVGALYLTKKASTVEAVLADPGPKRVLMHFLYKKVEREKLTEGWTEGFQKNSGAEMAKLQARLDDFNKLFADAKAGDVILLDYLPGEGTRVTMNGQAKGTIPGADFNTALLKVWLGESPADSGLKQAMLGG